MESSQTYLKLQMLFPYLRDVGKAKIIANNYQPVSPISNLSKLMEKIVHPRLYTFLEKNSLFFEKQYGFRNKPSTNHAIIDITSNIQTACDKGVFACGVFVDFKKPLILLIMSFYLPKLNHCGIRGTELRWFKTYMKGWQQHTTVNSFSSKNEYISYEVPQGSVLSPLLQQAHNSLKTLAKRINLGLKNLSQ